jgi:hypothetical protein
MVARGTLKRRVLGVYVLAALSGACSSTDVTYYGPPGGLTGKTLPLPRNSGSSSSGSSGGASSGSSGSGSGSSGSSSSGGASSGSSGSGGGSSGGGGPEAGPPGCAVSWTTQLFPNMTETGKWKCAETTMCHGGLQAPKMTSDPVATYKTLASYTTQNAPMNLPYILPGSTDATKSAVLCNLSSGACGAQMPLAGVVAGTVALTAQEDMMVSTWVACGSPNN